MIRKIIQLFKKIDPLLLLIIVVAILVSYLNFYGNFNVLGNDLSLSSLYWRELLPGHFYLWTDLFSNGVYNAVNLSQIFGAVFSFLFDPNHWLGFAFLLFLSNYLYYFWLKSLSKFIYGDKKTVSNWLLFFCSLLFTYNFYTLSIFTQPLTSYHLILIFLPLVFIIGLRALETKRNSYFVILSLVLTLALSVNLAHFLVMVSMLLLFLIFVISSDRIKYRWLLKKIPWVILMFLLFSAYVWLPLVLVRVNPYFQYREVDNDNVLMTLIFNSRFTDIFHISQMREMVWLSDFSYFYSKIPRLYFVVYSFLTPLYLLSLIFSSKNKNERLIKITFLTLLIIGLFLAKGFNQPLYYLSQIFYQIGPTSIFRNNYDKFVIIIQFAIPVLLMISLLNIKTINRWLYSLILIFGAIIIIFPFTLDIVNPEYKTRVPDGYSSLSDLDQTGNILTLPNYYENGYVYADWYRGVGFYPVMLHRKNVNEMDFYKNDIFNIENLNNLEIYKENQKKILDDNFLAIYNVRYVVVDKTYLDYYDVGQGGGILAQLGQQKAKISKENLNTLGFQKIVDNDSVAVYQVDDENFLPEIFSSSSIRIRDDNAGKLSEIVSSDEPITEVQVLPDDLGSEKIDITDISSAEVSFKKISPTKYKVNIVSSGRFPLIFSQSFDKNWKLVLGDGKSVGNHFVANGYANGWLVDTKDVCRTDLSCQKTADNKFRYDIVLEYKPQRIFVYSVIISIVSLIFFISYGVLSDKKVNN